MRKSIGVEGFTLIEIMVVVVILGIMATVVIVNYAGADQKPRVVVSETTIDSVSDAIELFKFNHSRYPDSLDELMHQPADIPPAAWRPYLKREPVDGWNRPLVYRRPGTGDEYDLISLGADGREGGTGLDEDIWNHDLHEK